MNRLLIVSPHFCPQNTPDMQRVRMSLTRFLERGWRVTVLTVDDPTPEAPLDPELAATLPAGVEIVRAHCLSRRLTGMLGIGNVALRALPFLFAAGCRLLAARRFDVVYFSTTMFSVLPLGRIWRALYGAPYVVDLQDPWVTDFYERPGAPPPPGGWKYLFARAQASILEGWSLRRAAHVISVTPAYLTALHRRYRWFQPATATVLPFGAPTRDFARLLMEKPEPQPDRITYVGRLGDDMLPALRVLFKGVALARLGGCSFTIQFLGTSYAPAGFARKSTTQLAQEAGLAGIVHEQTARICYLDSLRAMRNTGINLVLGSTDSGYVPSKLLACLASGRPTLVVTAEGTALAKRADELGLRGLVSFIGSDDDKAANAVASFLTSHSHGPAPTDPVASVLSDDDCADAQLAVFARLASII
jgi:hypothetical protein